MGQQVEPLCCVVHALTLSESACTVSRWCGALFTPACIAICGGPLRSVYCGPSCSACSPAGMFPSPLSHGAPAPLLRTCAVCLQRHGPVKARLQCVCLAAPAEAPSATTRCITAFPGVSLLADGAGGSCSLCKLCSPPASLPGSLQQHTLPSCGVSLAQAAWRGGCRCWGAVGGACSWVG